MSSPIGRGHSIGHGHSDGTAPPPRCHARLRAAGVLQLVMAAGLVGFWVIFFAGPPPRFPDPDRARVYEAFESAFPLADLVLALALTVGGAGLLRRSAIGPPASLAAAGALVFLGLLDVLFDVEQGLYARGSAAMRVETVINVWCLAVGPFLMRWFWRHRRTLDPPR